jgi:NDP-sugar pyrophosphorylase family protein
MKRAIILSGGKGERLRPLTEDKPKPMVEISGKPIMAHQVDWLKSFGICDITIACGYRHEVIEEYFGDGREFQVKIDYVVEAGPLGRGGALKNAIQHLLTNQKIDSAEPLLVMNGDLITNLAISDMEACYKQHRPVLLIATVPLVSRFGIMEMGEGSLIDKFSEKPTLPYWINAGIYILTPKIIDLLPDKGDHETTLLPELAKQQQLRAYNADFYWKNIEDIKDLREGEEFLGKACLSSIAKRPIGVSLD